MSTMQRAADGSTEAAAPAGLSRHFPATIGRFDAPADRAAIDGLVRWVEDRYAEDLAKRPSKHVYVETLPAAVIAEIDRLRDSPLIRSLIATGVPAGSVIAPMKHTDELYISHYNKDRGGDQGLFDKHYDGNLRFLSSSIVVRALIYLQSDTTYKVVFADSRLEKAFGSYEFGLLDFHRELHWVEGEYNPADRQRILLKCNYLVTPRGGAGRGARRARRQHRRVLRRQVGDGVLEESAHAAAVRRRIPVQPVPPAEQHPPAGAAGLDHRRRRRGGRGRSDDC